MHYFKFCCNFIHSYMSVLLNDFINSFPLMHSVESSRVAVMIPTFPSTHSLRHLYISRFVTEVSDGNQQQHLFFNEKSNDSILTKQNITVNHFVLNVCSHVINDIWVTQGHDKICFSY